MTRVSSHSLARPVDYEFFDRELASFVPDNVFDAHCHIWPGDGLRIGGSDIEGLPDTAGLDEYSRFADELHPGRQLAGLFLAYAPPSVPNGVELMNAWVAKQVARDPAYRGAFFIRPNDDPQWVRQEVRRLGLHGLKCYHQYAPTTPTWEARIPDYLPEQFVQVAGEEGWCITLHMVRSRAVADPENIYWIRRYCEAYPNMRLILAHSARGFQPAHNFEGLTQLRGLDNLYFDTSANCEPLAHQSILRIIGPKRLMYGSDFPVSHHRGRSVAASDSFFFVFESAPYWKAMQGDIPPVLLGLEHLRSLKWACWSERLTDSQIEDIFYNNAAELLGVVSHTDTESVAKRRELRRDGRQTISPLSPSASKEKVG